MMSKRGYIILGVLVFISTTLCFFTLTRGHPWWDDFAGYLLQAKSIQTWSMDDFIIHNTFLIEKSAYPPGPVAYPWGFPLLLVPVYTIFGLNPLALKLINLVFYAIFLVAFTFLARKRVSERDSLVLTGLFAVAPAMIAANDLILSDIPFLAVSTVALLLIDSLPTKKMWWGISTGALVFLAFFLRTNGILLLVPLGWVMFMGDPKNWRVSLRRSIPTLLSFSILTVGQMFVFPAGQSSYFSHFSMFSILRLWQNFIYYLQLPAMFFDPFPGATGLYILLSIFAIFGLKKTLKRDPALYLYGLLTVSLFVFWPERQGLRFIYPVLPVFFIAVCSGIQYLLKKLTSRTKLVAQHGLNIFFAVILVGLFSISARTAYQVTQGGREINGPFDPYSMQMYEFIKEQTPAESVIIFVKPRALRLFTGRDAFMTDRCEDLATAGYIVLSQKMEDNGQISPDKIDSCNITNELKEVFRNKRFLAYKITK